MRGRNGKSIVQAFQRWGIKSLGDSGTSHISTVFRDSLIRKHKTLVASLRFEDRMCHTGENCSDLFIGSHGRLTSIRAQGKKSLSTWFTWHYKQPCPLGHIVQETVWQLRFLWWKKTCEEASPRPKTAPGMLLGYDRDGAYDDETSRDHVARSAYQELVSVRPTKS